MAGIRTIGPLLSCVLLAGSSAVMASSADDRHDRSGGQRRHRNVDADRIVRRAYQDILDREPDEAGLRQYRSRIIDDGWSEAQVRDALRKSPEYRQKSTMTRQKAQDIVRRAYLSVLKREPDAASRGYVDRILRDKWTQSDVERELRKSPEYRR
jgi:TorA maturation chaperone TorD